MTLKSNSPGLSFFSVLFVALALSIGCGVRGNWGHEYGAMVPGALAAVAAVLASGREDWYRRIPFFLNACLCTLLALLLPCPDRMAGEVPATNYPALLQMTAMTAVVGTALVVVGEFGLVRALWCDTFAGHAGLHIRFGPDATLDKK